MAEGACVIWSSLAKQALASTVFSLEPSSGHTALNASSSANDMTARVDSLTPTVSALRMPPVKSDISPTISPSPSVTAAAQTSPTAVLSDADLVTRTLPSRTRHQKLPSCDLQRISSPSDR
eukprot:scaffold27254_cov70-Phaeocystis_antarctica.AAC.4